MVSTRDFDQSGHGVATLDFDQSQEEVRLLRQQLAGASMPVFAQQLLDEKNRELDELREKTSTIADGRTDTADTRTDAPPDALHKVNNNLILGIILTTIKQPPFYQLFLMVKNNLF